MTDSAGTHRKIIGKRERVYIIDWKTGGSPITERKCQEIHIVGMTLSVEYEHLIVGISRSAVGDIFDTLSEGVLIGCVLVECGGRVCVSRVC